MSFDNIGSVIAAVGAPAVRAALWARERGKNADLTARIRAELAAADSATLPELVTRVGMKDGFLNRGKVVNAIRPLVPAGEVLQDEPPGTTARNRLSVLRYRLSSKQVGRFP